MNKDISNIKYKCVICKKKFKGSETFKNHLCLMRNLDLKLFITIVEGTILIKMLNTEFLIDQQEVILFSKCFLNILTLRKCYIIKNRYIKILY